MTQSPADLARRSSATPTPRRGGPSFVAAGAAVLLSALCSVLLLWPQHGRVWNWDEADYLNASRKGVIGNLWESGSLSIPEYVRFVLDKVNDDPPRLPQGYDEADDPFKLRHGHSPAVVTAMVPFAGAETERPPRAVQMLGAIALTAALVVAYRLISETSTWTGLLVILLVAPWYGWHMFRSIQFHGWSTVWMCLAVAFLCRWLTQGRSRTWGIALCASLAALILTLESSAFVLMAVVVCLVIWVRGVRRRAREPWIRRHLLPGLLVVLGITVAVWPGLVLKGGFLKLPAERYAQVSLGGSDIYYFNKSADLLSYLLPAAVGLLVIAYLWRNRRRDALWWGPLVVVSAVYLASVIRFAVSDAYFLPAFAPLLLLAASVAGDLRPQLQKAAVGALAVVMVLGTVSIVRSNDRDQRTDRRARADLAFLDDFLGTSPALFDGGHVYRHYLPDRRIADVSYNATGLLERRAGEYEPVPPSAYAGAVIGILSTRRAFLDGPGADDLSARCPRIDRPTVVLWDCRSLSA